MPANFGQREWHRRMFFSKGVQGSQARENLRCGEDNQGPVEAEPDQALKDERPHAHAEKFSERGKPSDLPPRYLGSKEVTMLDISGWVSGDATLALVHSRHFSEIHH
jgi:hypothetical protein